MPADLREFLADRDVPCPGCRYNLRGLRGDQCPECGLHLEPGMFEPVPLPEGSYVFGGAGLLFFVFASLIAVLAGGGEALLALCLAGVALYVWIRNAEWVRTRPAAVRGLLALACWSWPFWLAAIDSLGVTLGLWPHRGWR